MGLCMMDEEKVKEYFSHDRFVEWIGAEIIELNERQAVVETVVKPQHQNANGCAQGGMLYTVADYTFALHANYLHPASVTQGGHAQYLRPVKVGETLRFTARETVRVGRNSVSEVVATNAQQEVVCVFNFNAFIKELK